MAFFVPYTHRFKGRLRSVYTFLLFGIAGVQSMVVFLWLFNTPTGICFKSLCLFVTFLLTSSGCAHVSPARLPGPCSSKTTTFGSLIIHDSMLHIIQEHMTCTTVYMYRCTTVAEYSIHLLSGFTSACSLRVCVCLLRVLRVPLIVQYL